MFSVYHSAWHIAGIKYVADFNSFTFTVLSEVKCYFFVLFFTQHPYEIYEVSQLLMSLSFPRLL